MYGCKVPGTGLTVLGHTEKVLYCRVQMVT